MGDHNEHDAARKTGAMPFWFGSARDEVHEGLGAQGLAWDRVRKEVDRRPTWRSRLWHHRVLIGGTAVLGAAAFLLTQAPTWFAPKYLFFENECGTTVYFNQLNPESAVFDTTTLGLKSFANPDNAWLEVGTFASFDTVWMSADGETWEGPFDMSPHTEKVEGGILVTFEDELCL